ncbi:MAG: hypothetical protein KDA66_09930 [Planctomycetaceae bacterium]|nr:hypothetical protein [Planctomycetaceae bacterium]
MLQHITRSLHSYWAANFTVPVPTCFPGVPTRIDNAPAWIEIWVDALREPPRRRNSPEATYVLITIHAFSRHEQDKLQAQTLVDSAAELLSQTTIPIYDELQQPLGWLAIQEPQTRDLTRASSYPGHLTQHLVLSLSAIAQRSTSL